MQLVYMLYKVSVQHVHMYTEVNKHTRQHVCTNTRQHVCTNTRQHVCTNRHRLAHAVGRCFSVSCGEDEVKQLLVGIEPTGANL